MNDNFKDFIKKSSYQFVVPFTPDLTEPAALVLLAREPGGNWRQVERGTEKWAVCVDDFYRDIQFSYERWQAAKEFPNVDDDGAKQIDDFAGKMLREKLTTLGINGDTQGAQGIRPEAPADNA